MKTIKGLRWWIITLVCVGTIVNYLSRNALGVMAPELMKLLHMSTQQYSYVVGAFQVGYTVMQPVCSLIIDLIGLRLGFALFACLWSLTVCSTVSRAAGFPSRRCAASWACPKRSRFRPA